MAEVGIKLEQRYKQHAEVMQYNVEFLQMLSTGDPIVGKTRKCAETVDKISSKIEKAKSTTNSSKQALSDRSVQMEKDNSTKLSETIQILSTGDTDKACPIEPDTATLKQNLHEYKHLAQHKERDCEELRREIRKLDISKKQRRLQRKIADVQFDMTSTHQHVKGFHKDALGDLQTFEFDFSKDTPCDVSDHLWAMA